MWTISNKIRNFNSRKNYDSFPVLINPCEKATLVYLLLKRNILFYEYVNICNREFYLESTVVLKKRREKARDFVNFCRQSRNVISIVGKS